MAMRVIGGRSRGRRLAAKLPPKVRPTSDRVREAVFDIVGSRGGVQGWRVADLFSGSGALGIEALSRGAASVTFVDQDDGALLAVRENLRAVGLADEPVRLVRARLPGWLGSGADEEYDLAVADPPYDYDAWPALLGALRARRVVAESAGPVALAAGWVVVRERRYGGTLITVAERVEASTDVES
jgi:16S rRNA (guanine966-N2)-methyltransferase